MSDELDTLRAENEELRSDVENLMGMMTNVVAMLVEIDIATPKNEISAETRERFQSAAGIYCGYTQKKILDAASAILASVSEKGRE